MHRDVYAMHQLGVIDEAVLQVMTYTLMKFVWHYEILSGKLAATFLIKYCSLLGSDLDC